MTASPIHEGTDFFDRPYGLLHGEWRSPLRKKAKDIQFDARLLLNASYLALGAKAQQLPTRNVLIMGVEVPQRTHALQKVMHRLSHTRHQVTLMPVPLTEGRGKFQNINAGLRQVDPGRYDWLIVVDDDIAFSGDFLDRYLYLAEQANLHISMPAHAFSSYQTFELTLRHWNSMARLTHFVESGPFTAFMRPVLPYILPFPELRWAWGTDIWWSEIARNNGFRLGILDALPLRHLRPVAASYDWQLARDEAKALLVQENVTRGADDILRTVEVMSRL